MVFAPSSNADTLAGNGIEPEAVINVPPSRNTATFLPNANNFGSKALVIICSAGVP